MVQEHNVYVGKNYYLSTDPRMFYVLKRSENKFGEVVFMVLWLDTLMLTDYYFEDILDESKYLEEVKVSLVLEDLGYIEQEITDWVDDPYSAANKHWTSYVLSAYTP